MAEPPAGDARLEVSSRAVVPGARRVGPAEPTQPRSVSIRLSRRPGAPPLRDPAPAATAAADAARSSRPPTEPIRPTSSASRRSAASTG